jgi:valyl-tRNA synthetase
LRDWCISRQIWFGHQIPAFYDMSDKQNFFGFLYFGGPKSIIEIDSDTEKELNSIGEIKPDIFSAVPIGEKGAKRIIRRISFGQARYLVDFKNFSWEEFKNKTRRIDTSFCKNVFVPNLNEKISESMIQDPDTLDTWFSSGLWTFSTLGYPNETLDLKNFHPTSVLETGYDILFFWVARMILMTTYTLGVVPFKTVYLHGLVRDEKGKKMSKSLGNIIDPLDMIEKYGTDATRLSLLLGNTPGNDMKLSEEKIAGFRNFTNKLWNISRFMLLNIENPQVDAIKPVAQNILDEWILWELERVIGLANKWMSAYQFSLVGDELRDFTWSILADQYLEYIKNEEKRPEILNYVLNTLLKLWHPIMPFVTETIWQEIYGQNSLLMIQNFPEQTVETVSNPKIVFMQNFGQIVTKLRSVRTEYKIDLSKFLNLYIKTRNSWFEDFSDILKRLVRLNSVTIASEINLPTSTVSLEHHGDSFYLDLSGAVDAEKEKTRITKELEEAQKYSDVLENKLSNEQFVNNAPEAVVRVEKEKLQAQKEKIEKLKEQLKQLL